MTLNTVPKPPSPAPNLSSSHPAVSPVTSLFNRLQPTPETTVLLLAVFVGSGAGAGVVILRFLIHFIHRLTWREVSGFLSVWGHWTLALIPLLGGIVVGLMRWRIKDFGPGLSTLLETVQGGGNVLPIKPVSKMVAAAVSLGTGASLGPEGPSVEIGANFSVLLGQVLQVSQERQRLLLGAGAAAGLAAGFNAPIAGVFFALEVVLGTTFASSVVSVVVLAAVVAAWIAQIGLGFKPAFSLPAYDVRSLLELPLYVGLGLLASLVSVLFKASLGFVQQCFQGKVEGLRWLAKIPHPFHPMMGGLCVGLVALQFPQILGVGYETVEAILQDVQFPLTLVFALLVLKLAMTALSSGSGLVGGIFAPALFLGAALGSSYGKMLAIAFPVLNPFMASPPAYAMVGMAAVLAGCVRAPLTAVLLLFELTRDYRIVLPLMAAVGLSVWLVERLQPTLTIDSNGEQQPKDAGTPGMDSVPSLTVGAAMDTLPLQVAAELPLLDAVKKMLLERSHCLLVVDQQQHLVGIVTLQDINRLLTRAHLESHDGQLQEQLLHQSVGQVCNTDLLIAYEEELLTEAIDRMTARGLHQLPVVQKDAPLRVVGLITPEDAQLTYGLTKTSEMLHTYIHQSSDVPNGESVGQVLSESR
jgi:H+/Cl- antiporter ClcA